MPDFLAGDETPPLSGVLTSLIHLGVDPERIEVLPVGVFRAFRGVLVDVLPPPHTEVPENGTVRVYVAERSIADRLPDRFLMPLRAELIPDALFDAVPSKRIWRSGALDETEAPDPEDTYSKGLDGGRSLLRVVDSAARRVRRDLMLLPHRLAAGAIDREIAGWLLERFGLESVPLQEREERFLALHLPGFPAAVGARGEVEALGGRLLEMPVALSEDGPRPRLALPPEIRTKLGASRLGVDSCIGETMADPQGSLVARLGPIPTQRIEEVLGDRERMKTIRRVLEAVLPAWCELRIEFLQPEGEEAIVLGKRAGGLLGFNSRLRDQGRPPRDDPGRTVPRPSPVKPVPPRPPEPPPPERPRGSPPPGPDREGPKRRRTGPVRIMP